MNDLDITVGVDARWVPLPLSGDVDTEAAQLARQAVQVRGVTLSDDDVEQAAAVLAGFARRAAATADRLASAVPPMLTAGAWALCPSDVVIPLTVATLRVMDFEGGDDDAIALLVDPDEERHGDVDVRPMVTPTGPALAVRWRPVVDVGGQRSVQEQQFVVWRLPQQQVALLLTTWFVDLVEAGRNAAALTDLAALVEVGTT